MLISYSVGLVTDVFMMSGHSCLCVCFVQVTALVKLKECEDTHLGEEVDRNWSEVVTQQYVFDRLNREVRTNARRGLHPLSDSGETKPHRRSHKRQQQLAQRGLLFDIFLSTNDCFYLTQTID